MRALILFMLLAAAAPACSSSTGPGPTGLPLGAAAIERDLDYCGGVDPAQRLDVYLPPRPTSARAPIILHIHGGGWSAGDKASGPWFTRVGEALVARGYVVASANYRLAPRFGWPVQGEDVACAVRYLRENAARWGADPDRIGVWGNSAGGHLAAWLGTAAPAPASRVQAIAALYGIFDLTAADLPLITQLSIESAFGSRPQAGNATLLAASPQTHVSAGDPPFLLVHGTEDLVVPLSQSEAFLGALSAAGVPREILRVENAGHELEPSGGAIRPSASEVTRRIADFFAERLGG